MEEPQVKSKWKKRLKRVLLSSLIFLLLLTGGAYLVFRSATVQTYLVQKFSDYLNKGHQSKISIRGVNIKVLKNTLSLEGLLILDYKQDTLLYLDELAFDVDSFSLSQHFINAQLLDVDKGLIDLKVYKGDSITNLSYFINEYLPKDTSVAAKWNIDAKKIALQNFEFRYNDANAPATIKGIDYAHISLRKLNTELHQLRFDGDTLSAHLQSFKAKDRSGFDVHQLSADIKNCASFLTLQKFSVAYNSTSLKGDVAFKYKSYADYSDFVNKVKMNITVDEADILMGDIGYFAPDLMHWKQQLYLKGKFTGKVNSLKCKNLVVETGIATLLNGNLEMEGLPDINNTFIFAELKSLKSNYNDLAALTYPSDSGFAALPLPDMLKKLGALSFKGEYTGFINEFVAYGKLNTDLGTIITDVQYKVDKNSAQQIHGKINVPNFELGRLLANPSLGTMVLNGTTQLTFSKEKTDANFDGKVHRFDFNGYSYNNISLNAAMNGKRFSGEMKINDKYCDMAFNGDVNFAADSISYHFKANVNKAYLSRLGFVNRDTSLVVSASTEVNLKGNSIDEMEGDALVNNLNWSEGIFKEELGQVYFKASRFNGARKIDLRSEVADASLSGKFSIANVDGLLMHYFANFSNHLLSHQSNVDKGQDVHLSIKVKDFMPVQRLFLSEYFFAKNSNLQMLYDDKSGVQLSVLSDSAAFPGVGIRGMHLQTMVGDHNNYKVLLSANTVAPGNKIPFNKFEFSADVLQNNLAFSCDWNNDDSLKNNAHIAGNINILARDAYALNLVDTRFFLSDKLWMINNDSRVSWIKNRGEVHNLLLSMEDKTLQVEGAVGESDSDVLALKFNGVSLEFLNVFIPAVEISGHATGALQLSAVLRKAKLNASLLLTDLVVNKQKFGETEITSTYFPEEEKVTLSAKVKRITASEEGYLLDFNGDYFPFKEKEQLHCAVDFKNFRISLLQPYFTGVLSDIGKAKVFGTLNITGELKAPIVLGELQFRDFSPKIDYLNVNYDLNDKVTFKEDGIYFENFGIKGAAPYYHAGKEEGVGTVNGVITHNRFKDVYFNLEIKTNKLIALNTSQNNNLNYYGRAFVTGSVMIGGSTSNVVMYANLKTEKFDRGQTVDYTSIVLPLDRASELPMYDFVEFVKDGDSALLKKVVVSQAVEVPWLDMTFDFKITPDAKVKMIFDPRVGDEINAQGNSDMQFQITSNGKFTMNGTYEVEKGDYFFTVKNFLGKKFAVSRGGTVTWSGDPMEAAIDLKALYKVRTKVSSLMDPTKYSSTQIGEMSSNVPVNVVMYLKGNLWNPTPTLDLEVSSTNPRAQEIVNDNILGESERTKQAISLLMQGSFLIPDNSKTAGTSVLNAGLSNAKQFLTGQVNNYLSQITGEAFNVGIDYNAGADSLSNVAVTVGKNFLNDKVVVTGTFDIGKDASDMEVQYKLSQDITLKAFRKSQQNQKDQDGSIPTQGIGVFFRREFDTLSELWKKNN